MNSCYNWHLLSIQYYRKTLLELTMLMILIYYINLQEGIMVLKTVFIIVNKSYLTFKFIQENSW